jgi:uncharacterized protein (TIGR03067 family)
MTARAAARFQKLNSVQDSMPAATDDEGSDTSPKRASRNAVRRVRRQAQLPLEELLMKAYVGLTLLAAVLVAADAPDEAVKKEKQQLQGTWVAESVVVKGKANEKLKGAKFNFSGDKVTMEFEGKKQEGTYTIDATKSPKHIDLTFLRDGRKDLDRGIYQIEGDTLKMCVRGGYRKFDREGKLVEEKVADRPEKFDAEDSLITLKREKT